MLEFGLGIPANQPFNEILKQTVLADRKGIRSIWFADCSPMSGCREAFSTLSALAVKTENIQLCTGIGNPYNRHPALLAAILHTLQEISNGRMIFGLGAGSEASLGALGLMPLKRPLSAIREVVTLLRDLFAGNTVTHTGEFHSIHNAKLDPQPKQPIPIVLGGRGPKMIGLMGELGNGALLEVPPVAIPAAEKLLDHGLKKREKNLGELDRYLWLPTFIGRKTTDFPVSTRWITLFSITQTPDSINEAVGYDPKKISDLRNVLRTKGIFEALNTVTPEMIETYGLLGSPDQIIDKIKTIEKAGIKQLVFHSPFAQDPYTGIKIIGEEIMPQFQT